MQCERCQKEHNGLYGSGRFCSQKCAHARTLSKESKEKIRQSLLKERVIKQCNGCQKEFVSLKSRNQKYCSHSCAMTNNSNATGKTWKVKDSSKMGGPRPGGGRSKALLYESPIAGKMKLNKEEIEIAKVLDEAHLNWKRNLKGFPYITQDGTSRKYYPDFYIIDYDLYVEYKGWITNKMHHKMQDAQKRNKDLNLKIIYGNDKRYRKLGLCLEEVQQDPKKITRC